MTPVQDPPVVIEGATDVVAEELADVRPDALARPAVRRPTRSTTPSRSSCRSSSCRSSTSSGWASERSPSWRPSGRSPRARSSCRYAELTRRVSRRRLLGIGGMLFGGGFAAQALATGFPTFVIPNVIARIGGSPQHPVGNGLLAEQFPPERRGFAISAHIAGGNLGTVVVAVIGAPLIALVGWRGVSIVFGCAAALIALAILAFVREHGTDRVAAVAGGSSRDALRRVVGRSRPALAVPDVRPGRRRSWPRRRQPVRAHLPDAGRRRRSRRPPA